MEDYQYLYMIIPIQNKKNLKKKLYPIHIITNQHVVDSCRNINIIRDGVISSAKIKFIVRTNYLAILTSTEHSETYLKFRSGRNVSSLTDLFNDTTTLQLTAPVQSGNSGGPLLDNTGSIVGVIYAKLAENVNLAIKANVATMFLDVHEIDYTFDTNRTNRNFE
ncbi:MAG: serine protease [Sulfurovum sp.]|nr:serine protease [Sulfurovum sp.]